MDNTETNNEVTTMNYRRSEELDELFAALSKAQALFASAERSGDNPYFKSHYATLESALEATRKGRESNGLAVVQLPSNINGMIRITTLLGHASGQWIESTVAVMPPKPDIQTVGSVITYLRRYCLMAILGVAAEDDDGEAAMKREGPPAVIVPSAPRPATPVEQGGAGQAKPAASPQVRGPKPSAPPSSTPPQPEPAKAVTPEPAPTPVTVEPEVVTEAKPEVEAKPEPPKAGTIGVERAAELERRIHGVGLDPRRVLQYCKVARFEDLTEQKLLVVNNILSSQVQKKGGPGSQGAAK